MSRSSYPTTNDFKIIRTSIGKIIRELIHDQTPDEATGTIGNIITTLIHMETLLNNLLEHTHGYHSGRLGVTETLVSKPLYRSSPTSTTEVEK